MHHAPLPGKVSGEQRVILRESDAPGERLLPDRAAQPFGQRDHRVPVPFVRGADHERRRVGTGEQLRELGDLHGVHRVRAQDLRRRPGGELVGGLEPVAHRHDQERRPLRSLGLVVGAGDRAGHVLTAVRNVPPDRILAGDTLERSSGQERLERDLAPVLLADEYHQRRATVARVGDRVDRVAQAGGRVEVDERRLTPGQRVARRHSDDRSLVEAEDEPDIGRQIGEKRDLRRSRIAEDRGQPVTAHDVERGIPDRRAGHSPDVAVALRPGCLHRCHRADPTARQVR